MSLYVFLNWMVCFLTLMMLGVVVMRYRYLLLKPSIIVIIFFHIQVQWAAAFQASFIEYYLPRPWPFFLLSQVFPLVGLGVSFFFLHRKAQRIYARISPGNISMIWAKPRLLLVLFGAILFIAAIYLTIVPFSRTGIYAILVDPLRAATARETSLKLLDNVPVRYGFSLLKSAMAPMLSVLTAIWFLQGLKSKNVFRSIAAFAAFMVTLVVVMLPGARMPGGILILTICLALFIFYKMPIRPTYIGLAFLVILVLPILMTLSREGRDIDSDLFFEYMKGGIMERIFVVPMETGLWHTHYAQTEGFAGASGIPKLAAISGVEAINLGNIMYLKYSPYFLASGLSNTCFVFAYYSCFGILTLLSSLLGLWLLDLLALPVLERLKDNAVLLAAIASLGTSSFWFASTMYTTALVTNGFIFIIIMAFVLDRLAFFRLKNENRI